MSEKDTRELRAERGNRIINELDPHAGAVFDAWLEDVAPDFANYIREFSFGDIYSRPGLSLRDRQIAAIAALAAKQTAISQLKGHIRSALNIGLSKKEVTEVIIQTVIFCGFPATLNALAAARDVFEKHMPDDKA